jgi:hypothetical protein
VNEEALAHWGLLRQKKERKKEKFILITLRVRSVLFFFLMGLKNFLRYSVLLKLEFCFR